MRFPARLAVLGVFALAPAAASALPWPFPQPSLPIDVAVSIAMEHGVMTVTDTHSTIDADWVVEGSDEFGRDIKITLDGRTGEVERAVMDQD
jgi:hypothetical protein